MVLIGNYKIYYQYIMLILLQINSLLRWLPLINVDDQQFDHHI